MTTPYVTGTVSVTAGSAIVTGVGTGWLTSGLVAGQFGLDSANGNPVPVLSIDSDTQITLAKPWRGTSASAQPYWITYDTTPGQQTVANAQRLAEYIGRLDKPFFSALAGLIPAADKIGYFGANGAGALADFNAAARSLLAGTGRLGLDSLNITDSFDSAVDNGFYRAGPSVANPPVAGGYWFLEVRRFDTSVLQVAKNSDGVAYRRLRNASNVWSAWVGEVYSGSDGLISDSRIPTRLKETITTVASLNVDLPTGFYYAGAATVGRPPDQCFVIHQRVTADFQTQYAIHGAAIFRAYGRNKINGVWSAWQVVTAPVLGAVSQFQGTVYGSIIERGSNANGEYVRFADGTQICWFNGITFTKNATLTEVPWTYPIAFSAAPSCWMNPNGRTADGGIGRNAYNMLALSMTTTGCSALISLNNGATAQSGTWSGNFIHAIGRWF